MLLRYGVEPDLVDWYYLLLTHRDLSITLHGETQEVSIDTGFPQGGVCSAAFWVIAYDEALHIMNTHIILGLGYADDTAGLTGGSDIDFFL